MFENSTLFKLCIKTLKNTTWRDVHRYIIFRLLPFSAIFLPSSSFVSLKTLLRKIDFNVFKVVKVMINQLVLSMLFKQFLTSARQVLFNKLAPSHLQNDVISIIAIIFRSIEKVSPIISSTHRIFSKTYYRVTSCSLHLFNLLRHQI